MPTRQPNRCRGLGPTAWIASVACAGLLGCQVPPPLPSSASREDAPPPAPAPAGKTLLAHYMPWYVTPAVRGSWGSHWKGPHAEHHPDQTGLDGLPDIWSHYHPLIGLYDSSDPQVLECHLLQMKLAGIDGVVVDWYGIDNRADYPQIHAATRALFEATGRLGLKFAACYEDRSIKQLVDWKHLAPEQATNELVKTFQWMQQEWFTQPQYFQWKGRPLLLTFGPIYFQDSAAWSAAFDPLPLRPAFFGLHHLWRQAGADGGFTWVHYDPWEGTPDDRQIRARIGEVFRYSSTNVDQMIVSAYPGFNDVYTHENHHELDHRDGQTLRETIEVAMAGPWPLIQLVTWNDYGEGTMIEPTHEFGYAFLEIIQQARRAEQGAAFAPGAEDLRLPARLYALRRKGVVAADELDRIATLLSHGDLPAARRLLDQLDAPPAAP